MWSAACISRAVQILLYFHFHPSAWVEAHLGPANTASSARKTNTFVHDLARRKLSRNVQHFTLREATFLSRLAFLPLLEVPVLRDAVEGDSRWYKHDKERDFFPCFPLASTEAGLAEQRPNSSIEVNMPRWGLASNGLYLQTLSTKARPRSRDAPLKGELKHQNGVKETAPDSGELAGARGHGAPMEELELLAHPKAVPSTGTDLSSYLRCPPRRPGKAAAGGQGQSSRLRGGAGRCGAGGRHQAEAHPPPATPPLSQNGGGGGVVVGGVTGHQRDLRAGQPFSFGLPPLRSATRRERARPRRREGAGGRDGMARPWGKGLGGRQGASRRRHSPAGNRGGKAAGRGRRCRVWAPAPRWPPSLPGAAAARKRRRRRKGRGVRSRWRPGRGRRAGPTPAGQGPAEPGRARCGRGAGRARGRAAAGCSAGPVPRRGTEPGSSLPCRPAGAAAASCPVPSEESRNAGFHPQNGDAAAAHGGLVASALQKPLFVMLFSQKVGECFLGPVDFHTLHQNSWGVPALNRNQVSSSEDLM